MVKNKCQSNNNNNPEMIRFYPDHLKTKKMCKHTIKKLPFGLFAIDLRYKKYIIKLLLKTVEH